MCQKIFFLSNESRKNHEELRYTWARQEKLLEMLKTRKKIKHLMRITKWQLGRGEPYSVTNCHGKTWPEKTSTDEKCSRQSSWRVHYTHRTWAQHYICKRWQKWWYFMYFMLRLGTSHTIFEMKSCSKSCPARIMSDDSHRLIEMPKLPHTTR